MKAVNASSLPSVPKKRNDGFSVPLRAKSAIIFYITIVKASSAEENDTKIIDIWLSNYDSMPIS